MNLFGKAKRAPPPPDPAQTIMNLRTHLETLDKREAHIQRKVEAAVREARQKMAAKDKKGAMFCLKRKKLYEGEINKLQGARITLENQVIALESSAVNVETFRAMEAGAAAMRGVRGNLDAERVDDIMDNIQEEKDVMDQIGDALTRPAEDLFDDEELLNELNELENEDLEEALLQAPPAPVVAPPAPTLPVAPDAPVLPTAPHTAPAVAGVADDDELRALRELESSMAL